MGQVRLLTIVDAQAQLAKLDARLGVGVGAKRERAELLSIIPELGELVVDGKLTNFGQEQWAKASIGSKGKHIEMRSVNDADGNIVTITHLQGLNEYIVD